MWVEFFDDVATLPAPFNIIPTPKTISRIFSLLIEKICGKSWSISYHGKVRYIDVFDSRKNSSRQFSFSFGGFSTKALKTCVLFGVPFEFARYFGFIS